jgi:hypothetical protein
MNLQQLIALEQIANGTNEIIINTETLSDEDMAEIDNDFWSVN